MMRMYDILILLELISVAGIFYSLIFYKELNLIVMFGVQMVLTAMLMLRAEKYKKTHEFKRD